MNSGVMAGLVWIFLLAIRFDLNPALTAGNDRAMLKLQSMARMEPRYEWNLPKLCSFFARGECNYPRIFPQF